MVRSTSAMETEGDNSDGTKFNQLRGRCRLGTFFSRILFFPSSQEFESIMQSAWWRYKGIRGFRHSPAVTFHLIYYRLLLGSPSTALHRGRASTAASQLPSSRFFASSSLFFLRKNPTKKPLQFTRFIVDKMQQRPTENEITALRPHGSLKA